MSSLLEADNRLFAKFNKDIDVPDEIIKSCMSTMANLMILEENFRYSEDSDEDAEKCAKCEGMQPYINVLEHRLFKMCLAHCRNLGSPDDPTEDANTLFEKMLAVVEAKVAETKEK